MNRRLLEKVKKGIISICGGKNVLTDEPMSSHTTFMTGGKAAIFVSPESEEELISLICLCSDSGVDFCVIGRGSNLLVSDEGYDGVIICLHRSFCSIRKLEDDLIEADAGAMLSVLALFAAENCLSGLEFASGIPGTVGGAVYINAGAYGGEISDVFESCRYIVRNDEGKYILKTATKEEAGLEYRNSFFKKNGAIIISARFRLKKENDSEGIYSLMKELAQKRINKQPLNYPSAGSAFKRPQNGYAAALIEECGLKGLTVGGAQVSEKHSGFIINIGGATSTDVYGLIKKVQKEVLAQKGIMLEPEICFIGTMPE